MTGSTHAASGMLAAELVLISGQAPLEYWPLGLLFGAIAGLVPDLDHDSSTVTRTLPGPNFLAAFFPHRTFTHGIFGIISFAVLIKIAFPTMYPILFMTIVAGYTSHPVVDMFNPQGVAWLYPLNENFFHLPFGLGFITTGEPLEIRFFGPLIWSLIALTTISQYQTSKLMPFAIMVGIVILVALTIHEKKYSTFFHGVIIFSAFFIVIRYLFFIPGIRNWFYNAYHVWFAVIQQYPSVFGPVFQMIEPLTGVIK